MDAIVDRRSTAATVASVVGQDPGLAARVLALANSSQFGLTRRVPELSQAITLVGTGVVQTLAIANAAALVDTSGIIADAHDHAVRVAIAARLLAPAAGVEPDDAFAAGLLHDVGDSSCCRTDPPSTRRCRPPSTPTPASSRPRSRPSAPTTPWWAPSTSSTGGCPT